MDDTAKGATAYPDAKADPGYDEPIPKFHLVVDSEHKGKQLPLWSFRFPHMRCFHLGWLGFFCTFFSAYAAAPILEIIRDDLNLRQYQANMAGVVTTAGTVFARVLMGNLCDLYGPRLSFTAFLAGTSLFVASMSLVENAAAFICMRLAIGFGLATFVSNQYWASALFTPSILGIANAVAGGWGNAGGGITQIVTPYVTFGIAHKHPIFTAWRLYFLFPAGFQVIMAILILLLGQDLPDGNFAELQKSGRKLKAKLGKETVYILFNYRMWCLAACYAASFGVELALDNALAPYYQNTFSWSIAHAGNIAAIFGTLNFVSRPLGGVYSDLMGKYFGMRGRLWALFSTLAIGGMGVSVLGTQHNNASTTIALMVIAGWFLEMTCGTVYGVVPFVSRRSNGVVCGLVSAGGATGGVLWQAIFFLKVTTAGNVIPQYDAFKWLGVVIVGVSLLCVAPLYWPMWGGMLLPAKAGYTEEDYYYKEYSPAEREKGLHLANSAFAYESRSMRGMFRLRSEGGMGPPPQLVNHMDYNQGVAGVHPAAAGENGHTLGAKQGENGHANGVNGVNGVNGKDHVMDTNGSQAPMYNGNDSAPRV